MEQKKDLGTPISALSRKLSDAGIVEMSKKSSPTPKARISDATDAPPTPAYIDENANLEAPTAGPSECSTIIPTHDVTKAMLEIHSGSSSGYYSYASQSAPPFFQFDTIFDSFSQPDLVIPPEQIPGTQPNDRSPLSLRRNNSCTVGFLTRKTPSTQPWPRLGFFHATLPSVGEDDGSALCKLKQSNQAVRFSSPNAPAAKKQRIMSVRDFLLEEASLNDTVSADAVFGQSTRPKGTSRVQECTVYENAKRQPSPQSKPKPDSNEHQTKVESPSKLKILLHRCRSVPANFDAEELRGRDIADPPALPVIDRTSAGLNVISAATVARLLNGGYANRQVEFLIVDCRYPYEYKGGHIRTAVNIYTQNDLVQQIFHHIPAKSPLKAEPPLLLADQLNRLLAKEDHGIALPNVQVRSISDSFDEDNNDIDDSDLFGDDPAQNLPSSAMPKPTPGSPTVEKLNANSPEAPQSPETEATPGPKFVVIFHCEFSSQRAPKMAAFLRTLDRKTNDLRYPFLFYPELYVMKGGYCEFHKKFPKHCVPENYTTMFHNDFRADLRFYNRLTKQLGDAVKLCLNLKLPHSRPAADASSFASHTGGESKEGTVHSLRKVNTMYSRLITSPMFACSEDRRKSITKESMVVNTPVLKMDNIKQDERSPLIRVTTGKEDENVTEQEKLCEGDRSYSSDERDEDKWEINLRIAEAIVRVGRHVVAAMSDSRRQVNNKKEPVPSCESSPKCSGLPISDDSFTPISSSQTLSRQPTLKFSLNSSPNPEDTPVTSTRQQE